MAQGKIPLIHHAISLQAASEDMGIYRQANLVAHGATKKWRDYLVAKRIMTQSQVIAGANVLWGVLAAAL